MRVAQKKKTFARTAYQSLNSNPKTLRQRKKTDNNRREPQRPLLDRIICAKICIFCFQMQVCYSDSVPVSAGNLKSVHVPSESYRQLRQLVQLRDTFVQDLVAVKLRDQSPVAVRGTGVSPGSRRQPAVAHREGEA